MSEYPLSWVDFHWHARDWAQLHQETVARSLQLAEAGGGKAISAMPNTNPPLTDLQLCRNYLKLAENAGTKVKFYVHIGLTSDLEQVKKAVGAYQKELRIIGMKMFFGKTTGNLGIERKEKQYQILEELSREGFKGVLVCHFEKERFMNHQKSSGYAPFDHTLARPEIAEIASFVDGIEMAEEVKFSGKIHVAHVSTLPVIDYIANYSGKLELSCGVSIHHLLFDNSWLERKNDGVLYLCNPPLRSEETRKGLWEQLQEGKIQVIESDHAPHSREEKFNFKTTVSGINSGLAWPYMLDKLIQTGMEEELISNLTFYNAVKLYDLDLKAEKAAIDWNRFKELAKQYPYNPFREVFDY